MDFATNLLHCLCIPVSQLPNTRHMGASATTEQKTIITEKPPLQPRPRAIAHPSPSDAEVEAMASKIIKILVTTEKSGKALAQSLNDAVQATGWTDWIAKRTLEGLEQTLKTSREKWGPALIEAYDKAVSASNEAFAELVQEVKDHPKEVAAGLLVTLLAIGVVAVLAPVVLEVLGFSAEGPVAESFAAWFQSTYRGYVPKGSLMSFLQRLGMTWRKSGGKILLAKF
ncbi:hypothetical protein B0T16DRAFT_389726 [Cercophora newfieldiana]|uniref:Lincomycin-condensing protein lmbA n=1 Tax=Cercophora newfieldiana TaxID=92897 RepID=A0AA40CSD2_9PEZI|nr:hypothetical protein B0T16DRAFT_389726 [Cercophora newfieldiana]